MRNTGTGEVQKKDKNETSHLNSNLNVEWKESSKNESLECPEVLIDPKQNGMGSLAQQLARGDEAWAIAKSHS